MVDAVSLPESGAERMMDTARAPSSDAEYPPCMDFQTPLEPVLSGFLELPKMTDKQTTVCLSVITFRADPEGGSASCFTLRRAYRLLRMQSPAEQTFYRMTRTR